MAGQKQQSLTHITPFLVFFLVHSMQIGVGVFGFQRYIAMDAEYNAWIAVIMVGALLHIPIWMIYKMMLRDDGVRDVVDVHRHYFGRWIGGLLSYAFLVYFLFMGITVLRTYVEVVQIWMFPTLMTWPVTLIIILIIVYGIYHGFRVVAGIAFLGVVLPFALILTAISPLEFANFHRLLPIEFHLGDQLAAMKTMTLSYIGFEALAFYFPFIQDPKKSMKWAHLGNVLTIFIYFLVTIVTFLFYSRQHLERVVYPTLSSWKVLELPFIERFEYIGIAIWLLVITPNVMISLWTVSRGMKKLLHTKQKYTLFFAAGALFLFSISFQTRESIDRLNSYVSEAGFYIIFCYIPVLFIVTSMIRRFRKNDRSKSGQSANL
ncbi:GerAB/ArcD/ProY family transporter [Bacillus sp. H-16]|uniref:GerAB/ArcD/ProY family transporter n=1 Tax=Alteribacter salitolerans TaxID=2912333 RepID=UPI00196422E7|nr:GerAB/ArcD/ProY family transporter [Alteribacter salitolerans]MBM7094358.1 GerAB/ArcD/ProY family transporter [Alteribacter salitolerans]